MPESTPIWDIAEYYPAKKTRFHFDDMPGKVAKLKVGAEIGFRNIHGQHEMYRVLRVNRRSKYVEVLPISRMLKNSLSKHKQEGYNVAMDRTGHISDLITMYTEMRNEPSVNKKAVNKTISKLEEAELWAGQIRSGKVTGLPTQPQAINGSSAGTSPCICPDGAVNTLCPIHGSTTQ